MKLLSKLHFWAFQHYLESIVPKDIQSLYTCLLFFHLQICSPILPVITMSGSHMSIESFSLTVPMSLKSYFLSSFYQSPHHQIPVSFPLYPLSPLSSLGHQSTWPPFAKYLNLWHSFLSVIQRVDRARMMIVERQPNFRE